MGTCLNAAARGVRERPLHGQALLGHAATRAEARVFIRASIMRVGVGVRVGPAESCGKSRQTLLGLSQVRRLLAVMYAERGGAIRIISARPATLQDHDSASRGVPFCSG